ncbi:hypothetical protein DI272_23335 [Streptomyces sp. Act143]|uniref:hypothetical protein n=1 Tax=Streptomyces sp. Act143 TaxID=2200760 RepID=UPI000D675407|nr:hypothetical protein [Streptomyces sp. Act143]PWI20622.1 hypothetical protein DI272_23335 [Streptomyces sp. Act143]
MDIGALVVDTRDGRIGVVMGKEGPYVQLRPLQGGVEWDVPPDLLRASEPGEVLSAKVAVANGRWGK